MLRRESQGRSASTNHPVRPDLAVSDFEPGSRRAHQNHQMDDVIRDMVNEMVTEYAWKLMVPATMLFLVSMVVCVVVWCPCTSRNRTIVAAASSSTTGPLPVSEEVSEMPHSDGRLAPLLANDAES